MIGLVPQELSLGAFDTVWNTLSFSRGLFGKKPNPAYLEQLLKDLSLWDKKDSELMTLSGGMKRRVLIGKALSHEPSILFLDEPTAGVDVELRKDMWTLVRRLRESGVTIILTTHYIEEAEEIADRVGVINDGELILVDDKQALMHKLGKKQLIVELEEAVSAVPDVLALGAGPVGRWQPLTYTYDPHNTHTGITGLLQAISEAGLVLKDLNTTQSSLEEIFVNLVKSQIMNTHAVKVIYKYEMLRAWETLLQSFASPVISTALYFVVFGSAIGSRIEQIEGVSYGTFIVPGLMMLALLTQSISNASFGIFFPKFTGTIYEVMSAPVSFFEI